jgi:predicted RNase H-like nuclease (RuvC/YqgF family)
MNRFIQHLSFLIVWFLINLASYADSLEGQLWKKIIPKLESILNLEDKRETLPDSALLHADKASNQKAINKLLDDAIEILEISDTQMYRKQIQDLGLGIKEKQRNIIEYEEKRIAAPKEKTTWKPWEITEEKYNQKIKELKDQINQDQDEIGKLKESLREELQNIGLNITDVQLDFLLATVIGDHVLQISVAFDNIKALTSQLEQIMVKSGENV